MTKNDDSITNQIELAKLSERVENVKDSLRHQVETCNICKVDIKSFIDEQRRCCAELEAFSRTQAEINKNHVEVTEGIQEKLDGVVETLESLERGKMATFLKLVFVIVGAAIAALLKLDIIKI